MTLTMPPQSHRPDAHTQLSRYVPSDERRRVAGHLLLALILVVLALTIGFVVLAGASVTFQSTLTSITPVDESTVTVTVQVENLGGTAAAPTCVIDLSSSAQAYTGTATIQPSAPIAAGQVANYYVQVPLTTDGSTHVNLASSMVTCH